jgi:non-ribosomal peptide synthetase component F
MASSRDAEDPFALSFFEHAAVQHGSKIALEDEDGNTLTYAKLNQRANQFAALLHSRQLGPGDVIALFLERSINVLVAVYGILKAGAGFCALDPANPPARSAFILQEIKCRLAVTDWTMLHSSRVARLRPLS